MLFRSNATYASITTGYSHACALTASKAAWCWGNNWAGKLGDGTTPASTDGTVIASATPGRLAYNMIGLATFFYVHDVTGSLTLAGIATGAETLASSLTAGLRGQLIDIYGQTRPLSVFVPAWVTTLTFLTTQHSHAGILVFCALLGVCSPPINLSARPLWRAAVGTENLRTAYALDTTMMNVAQITGPLVATALALSLSPAIALWVTAGSMFVGGTAMIKIGRAHV